MSGLRAAATSCRLPKQTSTKVSKAMRWANSDDRNARGPEPRERNPVRAANPTTPFAERPTTPSAFRAQERIIEPDEALALLCPMCESRHIRVVVVLANATVYTCDTCRGAFTITTDDGQSAPRRDVGA